MLILAVDDETLMLNMLVETLKNVFSDERYVVMGFDDGKEALEYVSSSEESLPYAFLDIRLRGMLGIELARRSKRFGQRQGSSFAQRIQSMRWTPFLSMPLDICSNRSPRQRFRRP